jgi:hypothetical protein
MLYYKKSGDDSEGPHSDVYIGWSGKVSGVDTLW